jgi:hypothetical protein
MHRGGVVRSGLLAAAIATGVALLAWSGAAAGEGAGSARAAETVTLEAAVAAPDLFPGSTSGDLVLLATNRNPYAVTFVSLSAAVVASSDPGGCPAALVSVSPAAGLHLSVPAGAIDAQLTIRDVVGMDRGAPDACQGVTFRVEVALSGEPS